MSVIYVLCYADYVLCKSFHFNIFSYCVVAKLIFNILLNVISQNRCKLTINIVSDFLVYGHHNYTISSLILQLP